MRPSLVRLLGSAGCALGVSTGGCAQLLGLDNVTVNDGPAPECPVAPANTVIACATITHVRPDGTTFATRKNLSRFTVAAYIVDSSASGFRIVSGSASSDGTARIDGVPDGTPFYFRLQDPQDPSYRGPHYFYTDKHNLDVGNTEIGRDDTPAAADTEVTVTMTGMTPWRAGDRTIAISFQTGTEVALPLAKSVVPGVTTYGATGDWRAGSSETTFADFTDAAARPAQLIDQGADHGDDLWMVHATARTTGDNVNHAVHYATIADAVSLTGTQLRNGSEATITGAFQAPSPSPNPLSFTMQLQPFRAAFRDDGRYYDENLHCSLMATPAAEHGLGMFGASLVTIDAEAIPGTTASINLTVPYSNPFPSAMPQLMYCSLGHTRIHQIPGTTRLSYGYSYITSYLPATNTFTLSPAVHTVTNLKVGGVDGLAGGAVAFDGKAPITISWDPIPGVTHYQIRVKDETAGPFLGVFDTSQSSIKIPADTFTRGNFYVFRLFAIQTSGDYLDGKVYDFQAPLWSARLSTGMFRFSDDCGNGAIDPGENCDPGVGGNTATCNASCTTSSCGDGVFNAAAGEECDDGLESWRCNRTCKLSRCGDGTFNRLAGEECDDGNAINGDGCNAQCKLEHCGDKTQDAGEGCDDGNRLNGDGCDAFCQPE